jgi:hypothetical protein
MTGASQQLHVHCSDDGLTVELPTWALQRLAQAALVAVDALEPVDYAVFMALTDGGSSPDVHVADGILVVAGGPVRLLEVPLAALLGGLN